MALAGFVPKYLVHSSTVLVVGCIGLLINAVGIGLFHGGHGHSHGGAVGHGHSHGEKSPTRSPRVNHVDKNSNRNNNKTPDDGDVDSDSDGAIVDRPGRSRSRIGQDCSHNVSLLIIYFFSAFNSAMRDQAVNANSRETVVLEATTLLTNQTFI
ncbi:unnamed protein product [Strongylus vulgaris]|uniref:Uncharacterized protein n=1 Tax=Strongylus vulgaris TaxID=40348 RepID=A0A3P7I3C9_STRVU|nr:unnamed protein product [Strongylus vulgaris]